VLTALAASPAWAQYAQDDRIEAPKAPSEFWRAVTFQMNTGKYDAAAFYMKGFLASSPSDQDLTDLEAKDGLAAFLRLRNVARWSPDAKVNDEAKKNAEEIITRVHTALEKRLGNQGRINRLVAALRGDPEERAFALKEVQRSGARAVPALVSALRGDTDATARATILTALPSMPEDSVAPLLASLDMTDARLRYEILQSLGQRVDFAYLPARPELNPLPALDYLSSSANQPKDVQQLARSLITRLRPVSRNEVKPGKVELTDAAMRFHKHQERFARPDSIAVWRWEGDDLALTPSTVSQAEEYFGLRYARWALELDPEYLPAQVAFLSIAADKAMGRAGIAADLTKADPPVHDLLATSSAAALMATLDQAIVDRRTTVALAVTKALAGRDEVKAAQPARYRAGVLVRALEFPDRRVQLAAADALVRIPGPFAQQNQTKVVEILRRSLSAESEVALPGKPRVLVAHYDAAKGRDLAGVFREAGFDVVNVRTGHELMDRVRQANDIDFVAIDSELPYPPLPDVLAHFRYDTFAKSVPVRVLYQPKDRSTYPSVAMESRLARSTPQTVAIRNDEERAAFDADNRIKALTVNMPGVELVRGPVTAAVVKASFEQDVNVEAGPSLSADERKAAAKLAIGLIRDLAIGQPGIDLKPADRAIRQAMKVDDLAADAIVAAGRLSGREAQIDLAALTLDNKRKPELRLAAAENLALHIQRFGAALTPATGDALVQLAASTSDPVFRGQVASVVGVLTPEGKTTGLRLQRYFAPKPGSTATKPAATPEKKPEPEKKPTPDDEDK
jgi:CheY-like chemotaxis protein